LWYGLSIAEPPGTYTVTYDSQGGSAVAGTSANNDTTISEPAAPARTGYSFGGWYKEAACINAWNFATDKVTANTTLYAKWTANPPPPPPPPVQHPGQLRFSETQYTAGEGTGFAVITVIRTGGSDGVVTVQYATSDGNALASPDYTATSGTLTFANGVTSQTFNIAINDDLLVEGDETVNLTLSNVTGGATPGTPNTAKLIITDDEHDILARSVSFTDKDSSEGMIEGVIRFSRAADESSLTGYRAYFINSSGAIIGPAMGEVLKGNNDNNGRYSITVPGGTTIPPGAEQFGVRSVSGSTESSGGSIVAILDAVVLQGGGIASDPVTLSLNQGNGTQGVLQITSPPTREGDDDKYTLPQVNVTVSTPVGFVEVAIPHGTTISGDRDSWNGVINVPTVVTRTEQQLGLGSNTSVESVIEIGFGDVELNFDNPVRILLSGKTGKKVGYFRLGQFYLITQPLDQEYFDADPAEVKTRLEQLNVEEAYVDNGTDLVVWTMHFTEFVTYDAGGGGTPQPGQLQFSSADYKVGENAGSAAITVTRTGGSDGAVTVDYTTGDGTALAGLDYTATSGTLVFNNGETVKAIEITILADNLNEGDETVSLILTNPTGGASLGSRGIAALTITDTTVNIPDDSLYELWPGSTTTGGVAEDRAWTVQFSREVDLATVNSSSIFICRAGTGERHPVSTEICNSPETGGATVTLRPIQPFVSGGSYQLYVSGSIRDKDGSSLARGIRIPFTIDAPLPDNNQYAPWTGDLLAEVAEDKEWQIKFNREVDLSTLSDVNIFVCEAGSGVRHPVIVESSIDPGTLAATATVKPCRPYLSGTSYVLYVDKCIKSINGSPLAQGIKMPFNVAGTATAGPARAKSFFSPVVDDNATMTENENKLSITSIIAGDAVVD
jgi:uncharacterized repeat protein (TIGR02543 family)